MCDWEVCRHVGLVTPLWQLLTCDRELCNSKDTKTKLWTRSSPGDTFRDIYIGAYLPDHGVDGSADNGTLHTIVDNRNRSVTTLFATEYTQLGITEETAAMGVAGLPLNAHSDPTDARYDGRGGDVSQKAIQDAISNVLGFTGNVGDAAAAAAAAGRSYGGSAQRSIPPSTYVCNICRKPGHWIMDCPEKRRQPLGAGVPPSTYVCHICNKPGHWIQNCPERNDRDSVRVGGVVPAFLLAHHWVLLALQRSVPPPSYVCRICNTPGHFITHCPERQSRSHSMSRPPAVMSRPPAVKRRWDDR